jgi:N-acyl-D-amino-acid deacylase
VRAGRPSPVGARALAALAGGLAAGLALLAATAARQGDALDTLMRRALDATGAPGAVVAWGRPGAPPTLRAYGLADPATGRAMTVEDRLKIASLSKPVTAAAILALVRDGSLALDDRLAALLPAAARGVDPRMAAVTVRDLLRHSGGWDRAAAPDPFFLSAPAVAALTGRDPAAIADCAPLADALLARPLQFAPGARFAYANVGYCWLGRLLAARFGAYAAAVRALVPEAAGLSLDPAAATAPGSAAPAERDFLVGRPAVIGPAGGWIGRAADVFAVAARPLDPAVTERPPYADDPAQHFGLGWRVWPGPDGPTLTHYGAMPGAFAVAVRRADGTVLVALFNGRPRDDERAFAAILEQVARLPRPVDGSGPS